MGCRELYMPVSPKNSLLLHSPSVRLGLRWLGSSSGNHKPISSPSFSFLSFASWTLCIIYILSHLDIGRRPRLSSTTIEQEKGSPGKTRGCQADALILCRTEAFPRARNWSSRAPLSAKRPECQNVAMNPVDDQQSRRRHRLQMRH
jgi:hypothetical protein